MQTNCEAQSLGYVESIHRKMRNLEIKCADSDFFKAAMNNELQAQRENLGLEDLSSVVRRAKSTALKNQPDSSVSARVINNHTFSPSALQLKPNPPSLSENLQNTVQNTPCKDQCHNSGSAFNPLPWQNEQMQALQKLNSSSENGVSTSANGNRLEVREDSGTGGYVLTSTRKDGSVVSFDITENARLLELEDGGLAVTLPDSGKRFVVNPDGTIRDGEDAEFVNGSTVHLGNGNNTVNLYEAENNSTLVTGNGNNTLDIYEVETGSHVHAENGNNAAYVYEIQGGSHVQLGNGDNLAVLYKLMSNGSFSMGTGSNRATVQ